MNPGPIKLQRLVECRKNHLSLPFDITPLLFACLPGFAYVAFSATPMLVSNQSGLASKGMLLAASLICSVLSWNHWKSHIVILSGGSSAQGDRSGSSPF